MISPLLGVNIPVRFANYLFEDLHARFHELGELAFTFAIFILDHFYPTMCVSLFLFP